MWQRTLNFWTPLSVKNTIYKFTSKTPFDNPHVLNNNASTHIQNQAFIDYLDSQSTQLKFHLQKAIPKLRVSVPKSYSVDMLDNILKNKLQKQWQGKALVFDIDPVHLIGRKRQLMKGYLQQQVYKNKSKPTKIFSQINPNNYLQIDELQLDPQFFIMSDPQFLTSPQQNGEDIQEKVLSLYETDQGRFRRRLQEQFKVPNKYQRIIQHAIMSEYPVYFCGMNSFVFRNIVVSMLTLPETKRLFMECLNYSYFKSTDLQHLQLHSKNAIYARNYHRFQKLENGLIMEANQLIEEDIVFFGGQYTVQSLSQSYEIVKDPTNTTNKSPDAQKIEKHAILQVLLGGLWNQSFTLNKFAYLSENYAELSEQDKQTLRQLYHNNVVKYKGAVKVFYSKKSKQPKQVVK